VHPADSPVSVNIRATNQGSSEVLLKMLHDSEGALTSAVATPSLNLIQVINMFAGIVDYSKRRGRSDVASQMPAELGMTRVTFEDVVMIEIPRESPALSETLSIQRNIQEFVKPVDGIGINELSVRREEIILTRVNHEDVEALGRAQDIAIGLVEELESEREVWLNVQSLNFNERSSWRFFDGTTTFTARMGVSAFQTESESGEPFRKGDRIRCKLREIR
jgi:hypothetical protein